MRDFGVGFFLARRWDWLTIPIPVVADAGIPFVRFCGYVLPELSQRSYWVFAFCQVLIHRFCERLMKFFMRFFESAL
jgi:hypothetical protein